MSRANPNEQSCGTCRFWLQKDQSVPVGYCRRNPPQLMILPGADGKPSQGNAFAPTMKDQWCGEWSERSHIEPAKTLTGLPPLNLS